MNTNTKRITNYITALISVVVLVCIDQFTKYLVVGHLKDAGLCTDQKYIPIRISRKQRSCIRDTAKPESFLLHQCTPDYRSCDLVLQQSTYGKKISAASYLCGIDRWRSFR
mgnify:FL=1